MAQSLYESFDKKLNSPKKVSLAKWQTVTWCKLCLKFESVFCEIGFRLQSLSRWILHVFLLTSKTYHRRAGERNKHKSTDVKTVIRFVGSFRRFYFPLPLLLTCSKKNLKPRGSGEIDFKKGENKTVSLGTDNEEKHPRALDNNNLFMTSDSH